MDTLSITLGVCCAPAGTRYGNTTHGIKQKKCGNEKNQSIDDLGFRFSFFIKNLYRFKRSVELHL